MNGSPPPALPDSSPFWRAAVACSGDALWVWQPGSGYRYRSPEWYALLDHDETSFAAAGLTWRSALHPDDFAPAVAALRDYLDGATPAYEARFRMKRSNGTWRRLLARGRLLPASDGQPATLVGFHRDIDAEFASEQARHENRRQFADLFAQSPDAIAVATCGDINRIVDVNPAYCALTGYTREELIGSDGTRIAVWDSPAQGRAVVDMLNSGRAISDLQSLVRRKDGSLVATSFSGRRIMIGGESRLLVIRRDITERTRIEQRLRDSEERWMFAIEGHGDALWDWNLDTGTVYRSPRWLELAGTPAGSPFCNQRDWGEIVHPADLPAVRAQNLRLIKGEQDESAGDCRLRRPDGSVVWVAFRGRVVKRGDNGRARRVIGTIRDITLRKQREAEIESQRALIAHQGRLLLLGEMATIAAHEVNQPLTAIANYAAACRRRLADRPDAEQIVQRIEKQALRAGEIVRRMRGFARRKRLTFEAIALAELVPRLFDWIGGDARARDVALVSELADDLPRVRADRVQIEQVLLNLIWNGIAAMETVERRKQITVRAARCGDSVDVQVIDCGVGVPESVALDIFKPFFSTRPDGLGLGLSICRSILADHGGSLWCTPGDDGGTIFSFSLPAEAGDGRNPT